MIKISSQFKKDLKKILKQGKQKSKLDEVVKLLQSGEILTKKFKDHELIGNWKRYRECHIEPNWLLIYKIESKSSKVLYLSRTGSHSELFKK